MQCPSCQAENPEKAKFCLECGAKLSARCAQCGAELPLNAKFCLECGARVDAVGAGPRPAPTPPFAPDEDFERLKRLVPKEYAERLLAAHGKAEGERRMVTILFSDVKGSTAMGERLDPEDVMEVMNGAFDVLIGAVYRHEGTLARLMGDAILAFFGAPIAHEDDPARAVHCALEIASGIQEYAGKLEAERSIQGFNIRVGINTGLVVVGEVGSDLRVEYTAMGDAINLAARMEQNAPVGGVLISHDTFLLVQGQFDMQALEPISVKGKSEPVRVYQVLQAKQRPFLRTAHAVAGINVPMVGREGELKQLQDAFYLAQEGERQMVTVVGEPGVGKSRLLDEFETWLDLLPERLYYFKGRAMPELQATPFALLRDLFAYRCQIQENDPLEAVQNKLEETLSEVLGAGEQTQMKAQFIGALLGYTLSGSYLADLKDDPQQMHDRALAYMLEYFRAASALRPAVLLFEDVHWADNSSLDVIQRLGLASAGQRLLVVAMARPGLLERRPRWGEGQSFHTRLELRPLSRLGSRQLISEILCKVEHVPECLRELFANVAEGNPLYVEELVKMLIEKQVILVPAWSGVGPEPEWQIDENRLAGLQVPPTLMGALQARLDGLSLEERSLLQCAAVIGRVFWDRALRRILATASEEKLPIVQIEDHLEALRRRELVFHRETSAFAGTQEYIFKHAVLREVAYESVLKRIRRSYHARVAEWLIEISGERAGEFAGLIGEHLELAEERPRALKYMQQAAQGAAARYANAEAVDYYTRALALLPNEDRRGRWELLLGRVQVLNMLGRRAAQSEDLGELERLAAELKEPVFQARAALNRSNYCERTIQYAEGIAAAQSALTLSQAAGDAQLVAEAHYLWGFNLWRSGRLQEGTEQAGAALALIQAVQGLPARRLEADILRLLASLINDPSRVQEVYKYLEDSLRLCRETGSRRSEALALNSLGILAGQSSDYGRAYAYFGQALRINREIENRASEGLPLGNLAYVCTLLGEPAQALIYREQALRFARETGDLRGEGLELYMMGDLSRVQGDYGQAQMLLKEALELVGRVGDPEQQAFVHWFFCIYYLDTGDYANLEAHLEELKKLSRTGVNRDIAIVGYSWVWLCLGRNDPSGALTWCKQNLEAILQYLNPDEKALFYISLGYTYQHSNQPGEAFEAFQKALEIRCKVKQPHGIAEAQSGLAAALLAQGDPAQAYRELGDIPALLESSDAWIMVCPELAYLNCYRVLNATDAPLGQRILQAAYRRLQKRAMTLPTDELRQSYWQNVPWNREIVALCSAKT